jgi:hypothetical protein
VAPYPPPAVALRCGRARLSHRCKAELPPSKGAVAARNRFSVATGVSTRSSAPESTPRPSTGRPAAAKSGERTRGGELEPRRGRNSMRACTLFPSVALLRPSVTRRSAATGGAATSSRSQAASPLGGWPSVGLRPSSALNGGGSLLGASGTSSGSSGSFGGEARQGRNCWTRSR